MEIEVTQKSAVEKVSKGDVFLGSSDEGNWLMVAVEDGIYEHQGIRVTFIFDDSGETEAGQMMTWHFDQKPFVRLVKITHMKLELL